MFKDRHARVEKVCERCGTPFMARVERVNAGQGRFCSLGCFNKFQKENPTRKTGYENGLPYFNKKDNYWSVRWFSEDGKPHNTSYAKWWWTLNVGQVPEGYYVTYLDGNSANIDSANLECVPERDVRVRNCKNRAGIPRPDIAGENSKWWKGGVSRNGGYSYEFSKSLKKRIKIRDAYVCQCCGFVFPSRGLDVHHINKDKSDNSNENLVTICKSCHRAIHGTENKFGERIEYYKSLLPNC